MAHRRRPTVADYEILDADERTSLEDLSKKYRALALIYHPDKGGKEEDFIALKDAYDKIKEYIEKKEETKTSKTSKTRKAKAPSKEDVLHIFNKNIKTKTETEKNRYDKIEDLLFLFSQLTIPKIKAILKELDIKFKSKDLKSDLVRKLITYHKYKLREENSVSATQQERKPTYNPDAMNVNNNNNTTRILTKSNNTTRRLTNNTTRRLTTKTNNTNMANLIGRLEKMKISD